MNILVTGAAGFIGSNLCMRLLAEQTDAAVVGIDRWWNANFRQECLLTA